MAQQEAGLFWTAVGLIGAGVLFYVLSVAGVMWGDPSSPSDIGLYSVTAVLVLFGLGAWILRWARLHPGPTE